MQQWCIPPKENGEFVACMEDVLAVYHRPYDPQRPVVCMDEKSKELHSEVREPLPCRPAEGDRDGVPARQDAEYGREGTANLFVWFEPLSGRRHLEVTARRTSVDCRSASRTTSARSTSSSRCSTSL